MSGARAGGRHWTARLPFGAVAAALTAAAALAAALAAPGRPGVVSGVALGAGAAGATSALALAVLRRIQARAGSDPAARAEAATRMVRAFAGLMLGRMVGYLAFLGAMVALKLTDALSLCAALAGGTVVFQMLEIPYLRKMS